MPSRTKRSSRTSARFNGAPDRNPGKARWSRFHRRAGLNVSMEPQIGIRGRTEEPADEKQEAESFNGAPDRNPGKEPEAVDEFVNPADVSMEPQIGIRGR